MAMETYLPYYPKERGLRADHVELPPAASPARPGSTRSLTGSTRLPSTDGPKMAAARPTPPARPLGLSWSGPARRPRLPRPDPTARPAPPRPLHPRAGPGAPLTMAAELLVRPPVCAAPRPEKEGLVTSSHYVCVPPPVPAASAAPAGQPPSPSPSSGRSSSPGPSPSPSLSGPAAPIPSRPASLSFSVLRQSRGLSSGGGIQRDASPSPHRRHVAPAGGRFDCGGRRWRRSGGAGRAAA